MLIESYFRRNGAGVPAGRCSYDPSKIGAGAIERRAAYGKSAVHLISAINPGIASAVTPSAVHAG